MSTRQSSSTLVCSKRTRRIPAHPELSALRAERDGAVDAAIDLLRAVLEEEPVRADAVRVLGELYERGQRYEDLSDLLGTQISQARDRGDTESELSFQVRLGDLYEG